MTRINCVPPSELHTKHLVAEYRELPRVFGLVHNAIGRGEQPDDPRNPTRYLLGIGHVRFFYPRLRWCERRFYALLHEMIVRSHAPQYRHLPAGVEDIPEAWWGDWLPDEHSLHVNRMRIRARMPK